MGIPARNPSSVSAASSFFTTRVLSPDLMRTLTHWIRSVTWVSIPLTHHTSTAHCSSIGQAHAARLRLCTFFLVFTLSSPPSSCSPVLWAHLDLRDLVFFVFTQSWSGPGVQLVRMPPVTVRSYSDSFGQAYSIWPDETSYPHFVVLLLLFPFCPGYYFSLLLFSLFPTLVADSILSIHSQFFSISSDL